MAPEKPSGYYAQTRAELVARLPRPLGSVLDVGCGEGGAAGPLRAAGAERITGIEIHEPAAARAREVYDEVAAAPAEEALATLSGPFDTILLYDVLEHLVDPSGLLRALVGVAAAGAHVHVSVPNARYQGLLVDLVLRGTFGYGPYGHRDSTHLRWFTKGDIVRELESAGWSVEQVGHGPLRPASRLLDRLSRGLSTEFAVVQWSVLARARGSEAAASR